MLKGASEDLEEYTKQAYQSVKEWGTQQFNYWTDLNEWENAIKSLADWRTWAYNLPVSGDCNRASICFDNGDYGGGLFNWGMVWNYIIRILLLKKIVYILQMLKEIIIQ